MSFLKVLGSMLFLAAGFVVTATVLAAVLDGEARSHAEHDQCLKQATNGYEIERCR